MLNYFAENFIFSISFQENDFQSFSSSHNQTFASAAGEIDVEFYNICADLGVKFTDEELNWSKNAEKMTSYGFRKSYDVYASIENVNFNFKQSYSKMEKSKALELQHTLPPLQQGQELSRFIYNNLKTIHLNTPKNLGDAQILYFEIDSYTELECYFLDYRVIGFRMGGISTGKNVVSIGL